MKEESEDPQSPEAAPVMKREITLVVALSMTIGILLAVSIGGGILFYRQTAALQAELLADRTQLAEKSLALDEMKDEIATLSRQIYALRDYSIARSSEREKAKKAEGAQAPAAAAPAVAAATTPAVAPPKKQGRPKPEGQNCEMVGKSPAEQAATLQRCVSVMDNPRAAKRSP